MKGGRPNKAVLIVAFIMASKAYASCALPEPDSGGGSTPIVSGLIENIRLPLVKIYDKKSSKTYTFMIKSSIKVYTAFGGDGSSSDLKTGLAARVWTDECKPADLVKNNSVAYFEVFSFSKDDEPPNSYFRR